MWDFAGKASSSPPSEPTLTFFGINQLLQSNSEFFFDIPQKLQIFSKALRGALYSSLLGIATAMSATQLLNPKAESRV